MWKGHYPLVILLIVASAVGAQADVFVFLDSYEYQPEDSMWAYEYAINNTAGDESVYYLNLEPADMVEITGFPTGWDDIYYDTSIGGFAQWSAFDSEYWVHPGNTLKGFTVQSPYEPSSGYTSWTTLGGDGGDYEGSVPGAQVPEPSSIVLVLLGLGGVAARRRLRRDE